MTGRGGRRRVHAGDPIQRVAGRGARRAAAALVLVLALAAGCTGDDAGEPTATPTPTQSTTAPTSGGDPGTLTETSDPATESTTPTPDATARCVTELADGLTERAAIGQLLMVGVDSGGGVSSVEEAVTTYGVGGVIYLGGWTGRAVVAQASREMRALADGPGLFIAADQEGGQVQQLRGTGFTDLPSATEQAAMGDAALASAAIGWAQELAGAGVNVNLAPVADTVPADIGTANGPIGQYHREYGATPNEVIPPMLAFLRGMQAGGVATTVKHFPGIGRITGNTDSTAAGITDDVATVRDANLEPFSAGILAGADFVMVSSARYPQIADEQALFAPEIVTDLLRERLGYAGVVITDDVGAAAAVADVPVGQRATRFLAAGGDIVLTARPGDVPVMSAAIADLAATDADFAAAVDAALERVLTLKTRHGLTDCG